MSTWKELAKRAQAATGPDLELDQAIVNAAGRFNDFGVPICAGYLGVAMFTSSVDAVLKLIAEKLPRWSASLSLAEGLKYPCVTMGRSYPSNKTVAMEAATPALALLAAFCMAMSAQEIEP